MYVTKEYVIDGSVVEYHGGINGIEMYRLQDNDRVIIYYVHGNNVIATTTVTADCGQNMGYIDDIVFENH